MNPDEPGPSNDDGPGCNNILNANAGKLEVYRRERLAYTDVPQKNSVSRRRAAGKAAYLKAIYYWVLWRS